MRFSALFSIFLIVAFIAITKVKAEHLVETCNLPDIFHKEQLKAISGPIFPNEGTWPCEELEVRGHDQSGGWFRSGQSIVTGATSGLLGCATQRDLHSMDWWIETAQDYDSGDDWELQSSNIRIRGGNPNPGDIRWDDGIFHGNVVNLPNSFTPDTLKHVGLRMNYTHFGVMEARLYINGVKVATTTELRLDLYFFSSIRSGLETVNEGFNDKTFLMMSRKELLTDAEFMGLFLLGKNRTQQLVCRIEPVLTTLEGMIEILTSQNLGFFIWALIVSIVLALVIGLFIIVIIVIIYFNINRPTGSQYFKVAQQTTSGKPQKTHIDSDYD